MGDEVTEAADRLVDAAPSVLSEAARLLVQELGPRRFTELLDAAQRWADTDPDARRLDSLAAAAQDDPAAARELIAFSRELADRSSADRAAPS